MLWEFFELGVGTEVIWQLESTTMVMRWKKRKKRGESRGGETG
jgi:hypothetical protein